MQMKKFESSYRLLSHFPTCGSDFGICSVWLGVTPAAGAITLSTRSSRRTLCHKSMRVKLSMFYTSRASALRPMDECRITVMRLLLATAALGIIYIDPSEPDRYVAATYTALTLYVAYSAMLCAYAWRGLPLALTPI